MISILIVDDHAVVRSGLRMLLEAQENLEVAGEASEGNEAYAMTEEQRPDLVLMDLSMPHGKDGLSATSEIKNKFPETNVLVLTMHDDEEYLFRAIQLGASGCILKNAPHDELIKAIHQVSKGDAYLYPSATKRLMEEYMTKVEKGKEGDRFSLLSDREKEVLALVAKGYSNKETGEKLIISVKTVEAHKANVMEKLQLKTRPELVEYAWKKGLFGYSI
ncbi:MULTISPECIES: response regulator [Salimicrobium]|uniref:DNA-binding response regulator n=3 Tax=Salimicrobium TaxID=351195 RepID=K2H8U0_9BACI|nr:MULTISPECIES: response regulator transcription factor [Salimicrobium]AKG03573.1 DNA-binding response regulator [Salimicrobium jeotgali]EKE32065.1 two-component response regulator [Salimicrobium jeotgali]MBM7696033.1 two-component system response regulator NreC [Salimicrobium jeotgali]SDX85420.1 two component transcriptional regulator, LuxR family [Salimicrobium album]SIS87413.1 two component transcriptional regulator, LuxR family [Salimicrobium salexigens]